MYNELLQHHQSNHKTWCYIVVEVLRSINVTNIWKTVSAIVNFNLGLKICFNTIFWMLAKLNIEKHPILRSHLLFKITLAAEPYLAIKMDARLKKYIEKFGVISHRLAIETGRHWNTPLPIKSRVCVHIPGELVDDKVHLITIGEYHDVERKHLYKIATCYITDFESLDNQTLFIVILVTSIPCLKIALENFLHTYISASVTERFNDSIILWMCDPWHHLPGICIIHMCLYTYVYCTYIYMCSSVSKQTNTRFRFRSREDERILWLRDRSSFPTIKNILWLTIFTKLCMNIHCSWIVSSKAPWKPFSVIWAANTAGKKM